MRNQTEIRPRAVVVHEDALAEMRSLAGRYDVNPKRVYGLAMEFAAGLADVDEFEDYVAQHSPDTGD